jgi:hypothetical protein
MQMGRPFGKALATCPRAHSCLGMTQQCHTVVDIKNMLIFFFSF